MFIKKIKFICTSNIKQLTNTILIPNNCLNNCL